MKTEILKSLTATGALLASFAAFADTPVYDETTGYVTCKTKSSSGGYVLDPATWSDGASVHSDTNYYIGVGFEAKCGGFETSKSASSFAPTLFVSGTLKSAGNAGNSMTYADLRMLSGAKLFNSNVPTWKGTLTILTPEGTDPVTFSHNRSGSYPFKLSMTVIGDAQARIVMSGNEADCSMTRGGDWSGFYGTYQVRNGYTINSSNPFSLPGTLAFGDNCTYNQKANAKDSFGNLTFGTNATVNGYVLTVARRFAVGIDSQVMLSDGSSFGTFSLGAGTTVSFRGTEPMATVMEKLELGEGVTFIYTAQGASMLAEDPFLPVMNLSADCVTAGLPSLDGLSVSLSGFIGDMPKGCALVYRDGEAGGKVLGVAFSRVIENLVGNVQSNSYQSCHAGWHRFLGGEGEADSWSNGHYPQATDDCYSTNSLCICSSCALPRTLIMTRGILFVTGVCASFDLKLCGEAILYNRFGGTATLNGSLGLYDKFHIVEAYLNNTLIIKSDIYGKDGVDFRSYYPTGASVAKFRLLGDNSQWSGKMKFSYTVEKGKTFVENETDHVRVYVDNSTALGGGSTTFAYDTIQLNKYGEIIVTNSATFANACRGVYVPDNGAIGVDAGQTARFAAPVTMGGFAKLRKNGDGTLVLGGPLRFLSGKASVEDPSNATNYYVDVTGGSLAVADCNALNGAKLAFSNETELAVFADVPEGDLKTFGVRCDKIASPFATDVPIRIVSDSELTAQAYSVALVTVKSEDAEAVAAKLDVKSGVRHYQATSVTSAPGAVAGTVTFTANFERAGLILIVR